MPTQIELEPYITDINQFTESVFVSMLGLEVFPSDTELPSFEIITGAIYYAGAWKGAVLLQCAPSTAYDLSARLMSIPQPVSFDDDVRDAIGEITNIISGNLKPILPHGVGLSMPTVILGLPSALKICGDPPLARLAFSCEAGTLWLSILGLSEDPS